VLDWLTGQVEYRASRGQPQAPAEVLARGSGNCVGLTRVAVAMLRAAGVPARNVHGFQLEVRDSRVTKGSFHRLLEVQYPGAGWIASDVGRTKNFLPPDTLVLAAEGEEIPAAAALVDAEPEVPYDRRVECRLYRQELLILDEQPWPQPGTLYAAWTPQHRQARGAIWGTLLSPPAGVRVEAEGARGRVGASRAGGLFAFAGLLPGSYTILVQTGRGELIRSGPWQVGERELLRLTLDLSALEK